MTDAPERMYADHGLIGWQFKGRNEAGLTEYIRADVHAAEITRLTEALATVTAERDEARAKVSKYEGDDGMGGAVVHAIRELLYSANVPTAAFIDDHVRNAIVQRNIAEAALANPGSSLPEPLGFSPAPREGV